MQPVTQSLSQERGILNFPNDDSNVPWGCVSVAGLQFYDYYSYDPVLETVVRPQFGDRVHLVRRPENAYDTHAVEVWLGNGSLLGHLPQFVAFLVAPLLDQGKHLDAHVVDPGDGGAWSLRLLLVGPAAEPLQEQRIQYGLFSRHERLDVQSGEDEDDGIPF